MPVAVTNCNKIGAGRPTKRDVSRFVYRQIWFRQTLRINLTLSAGLIELLARTLDADLTGSYVAYLGPKATAKTCNSKPFWPTSKVADPNKEHLHQVYGFHFLVFFFLLSTCHENVGQCLRSAAAASQKLWNNNKTQKTIYLRSTKA